jgi:hypothetical protein
MNYDALEALGRERLSRNFYMREFLYSEIANWHQLRNVPEHPDTALRVGRSLCTELLEPLQLRFGRIHIRSGYRSPEVNAFGNRHGLNCASNEKNYAGHIWDYPNSDGHHGAVACIVVPALADYIALGGSWTAMAWWIHDHLPYSSLCFFARLGAFNIGWHEAPQRRIDSFVTPRGCLTKPHMANHTGDHAHAYRDLLTFANTGVFHAPPTDASPTEQGSTPNRKPVPAVAVPPISIYAAAPSGTSARIRYRAVHTKSSWRRVDNHKSLENAIHGKDGAAGLFAGPLKRKREEVHGEPLFVVVWREGDQGGKVIRPHPKHVGQVELANIPIYEIEQMEAQGGATTSDLMQYFN